MQTHLLCFWLALIVSGCSALPDSPPYVHPPTRYGEPKATRFAVRYSELRHDPSAVLAVIAEQCGPEFLTARLFERSYRGTVLHPQEMRVICGDPPVPVPRFAGQTVDEGTLVELRRPTEPTAPAE